MGVGGLEDSSLNVDTAPSLCFRTWNHLRKVFLLDLEVIPFP